MKNLKLNDKVTVFDQIGVITDVVDETREPYLYGVTFDATQKTTDQSLSASRPLRTR